MTKADMENEAHLFWSILTFKATQDGQEVMASQVTTWCGGAHGPIFLTPRDAERSGYTVCKVCLEKRE